MGEIWVTSDWHLCHNKEFIWRARGFYDIDHMNETIVGRHNRMVAPNDTVYVLGDLCLSDTDKALDLISKMNGKKIIIRGNHDTDSRIARYVEEVGEVHNALYLRFRRYHFYLSHFPTLVANNDADKPLKQKTINLFGHTHQRTWQWESYDNMYNVGMDAHDCYPVNIETIISTLEEENKKCL